MRKKAATQPPKEAGRHTRNKRIQRLTLARAQRISSKRRDVEVRHYVAEEVEEGGAGEDDEESVFEGGLVEELAGFTGTGENGGAGEQGGEGQDCGEESDEAHSSDSPREADGFCEAVEHYDVDDTTYWH